LNLQLFKLTRGKTVKLQLPLQYPGYLTKLRGSAQVSYYNPDNSQISRI